MAQPRSGEGRRFVAANAGVAGLVAALVVGKRRRFGIDNMAPHNLVLSVVGAALLWVGWFGFNAGSALAANGAAGMALATTQIATAAAALAWMATEWNVAGKPSVLGILSGAVAGLVAITPAAGFVDPTGALAIGVAAGVACYWAATKLKKRFGYDDSLDVFAVHGIGGIVGAALTGVFATAAVGKVAGLIEGNTAPLPVQLGGIAVTLAYCGFDSLLILKAVEATIGLGVDDEAEIGGLDLSLHGETVP